MQPLSIGIVVASYPEGQSVDVLLEDDGARLANVQVMVFTGSSSTGQVDLPDIGGPAGDARWDAAAPRERLVRAVVGFVRGVPVVLGFLLPQVNQITFAEKNRRITRHASDVYVSVDDAGNVEVAHPSGTYLRIGEAAAHEDLAAKDIDKRWKIARNTARAVHVQLTVANGGVQRASLNLAPNGDVTLEHAGNLAVHTGGTASIVVDGDATIEAPEVTIDSPQTTCTGALTVQGLLTYQAGMAGSGGAGASAQIAGSVQVTGGDVTADGVGLKTHVHGGVQVGGGSTGTGSG